MSLKNQLDTIRDLFADNLPNLLNLAGLDDFEDYLSIPDNDSQKRQLVVYPDNTKNKTDLGMGGFIIKAQLYKKSDNASYFDVIEPFIREFITPELLGFTNRDSMESDFYPIDLGSSTSFIFFNIVFSSNLDDCSDNFEDDS